MLDIAVCDRSLLYELENCVSIYVFQSIVSGAVFKTVALGTIGRKKVS